MLTVRIIPCLDVKDGRVVKGVQFGNLRDAGSPLELALEYEKQGADELILLDIAATPNAREHRLEVVKLIRQQLSIPLTVGGGIRTIEDARLFFMAGADKVAVNTAAVNRPSLLSKMAGYFGRQAIVLALDAAKNDNSWEVVTNSGKNRTGQDAVSWAVSAADLDAGEIMLTSWDKDGTQSGYDLDLLKAISSAVSIPVIASGGAASPDDLVSAIEAGASAVLAASIFHYGRYTVKDIKIVLAKAGKEVRL